MANLRTNNLSGEQGQNAYRGSVFFNATPNAGLQMLSSDFAFGTGDFTVEGWFWYSGDGATIASIFDSRTSDTTLNGFFVGVNASGKFYTYGFPAGTAESAHNTIPSNSGWNHFAIVRSGNDGFRFLNGQQVGSTEDMSSTNYTQSGGVVGQPSNVFSSSLYRWKGYLSNIRVHKGEAIYTSDFTPPTSELKATSSNCVLLCCQDSDDPTQDATGKSITAQNLLSSQPKVIPPFGVDAGNAFGGPIQQSTQGYMYFPTGRTEQKGRGRGLVAGGSVPTNNNSIEFINIQSQGNALHFGDLAVAGQNAGASSSTRALFAMGGQASPGGKQNVIQFVEIATQGNAVDFGDRTITKNGPGGLANQTRAVFAGGGAPVPQSDVMDFVTIASLGNATDFGNMTSANKNPACTASSTRGIIVHGGDPLTNVIDFITIATAGNAQDFGDATVSAEGLVASSSPTRGIIGGGLVSPTQINNIMFITIATTGNATDFGDLTQARQEAGGISNSIRACFASGGVPSAYNTIDFVTIATRGDALDFGDTATTFGYRAGASDSHGGLS